MNLVRMEGILDGDIESVRKSRHFRLQSSLASPNHGMSASQFTGHKNSETTCLNASHGLMRHGPAALSECYSE